MAQPLRLTRPTFRPREAVLPFSARIRVVQVGCVLLVLFLVVRFFQLQVLEHDVYQLLAADQHDLKASLDARRGTIYVRDQWDKKLYPIAKDRDAWNLFAGPRDMKDLSVVAAQAAEILGQPKEELLARFMAASTSAYLPLAKDIPFEKVESIREKSMRGLWVARGSARLYPETGMGGQLIGFTVTNDTAEREGRYGIEGFENTLLAGAPGMIEGERDALGRRLAFGQATVKPPQDGADVVLTIDRSIQQFVCAKMEEATKRFEAEASTAIVINPETGAILGMCSYPNFLPSEVGKIKDIGVLNNPAIFHSYEPGSIFKAFTMAAGIEAGKITPQTTYVDKGLEEIDGRPIRNSDKLAHGTQSMLDVLEKSLNTGTIFVQRLVGKENFKDYLVRFGFGDKTGIELPSEVKGTIANLDRKGQVFAATASYGQGITTTPLQLVAAYAALANNGTLMKPYIVQEIIQNGVSTVTKPQPVREVVSSRTARLVTGMLVNVVENGHGKRAGVPGYYVAGKTGTAQIADPKNGGYLPSDVTIGSFAGYAPADHPVFAMIVRIDRPKTVQYAESSAAPIFGEIAQFLMSYFHVEPERPLPTSS
ncbi:penicillin-binding protein 2 [Patescibacteria group bacterium]|nr:penicillin-binding protein 2 [Patescibacteria group bacterium]